ncbi:MAG: hypothetical protein ACQETL_04825 [Bacteroidota bacterium]
MKNTTLILTFLVLFHQNSKACDCKSIENLEEIQELSYQENELIFIGEAIESNEDGTYQLRLIELLKGTLEDSVISGITKSSCSLHPKMHEIWLVYVNKNEDGTIEIYDCGLSRNFKRPYFFSKNHGIPVPPHPNIQDDADKLIDHEQRNLEIQKQALKILKNEIIVLRKKLAKGK